jgi:hypothetical protein
MHDEAVGLREELQQAVAPRYAVGDEIGRGGMAIVFRGRDLTEPRDVAFKVLKRQLVGALGPTRFLREIRLLGALHHPSILPMLGSGQTETLHYFIMPLVEGETLQARLAREGELPLDDVRRIVSQVAAALDYAHEQDIVHRDIKPSNLFLAGGRALVADFGIAKDLDPTIEESTTSTGLVVGTAMYMSPEQANGRRFDRRSDVYSLGCVTYEMLAGEPPFTGPSAQHVIARHMSAPTPSVRLVRPDLPAGVDEVVRKALAKSPADRWQRAGDFAAALSDPVTLATAARRTAAIEEGAPAVPRRPLVLLGAFGLAVVAAGVLLWPRPRLDADKVVVFPLGVTPRQAPGEGTGTEVALMIGSSLEYTDPLEWIDGLPLLTTSLREDPARLSARDARRIARAAGARWYVDGTVVRRADSVTVIVRLSDAEGDSVVGRASVARPAGRAAQAGLAAVNQLLPRLLSPGRRMGDLSPLEDRHPAAVASWLQGEREYRRFDFPAALDFERRAVAADSLHAVAALRGAQAASWLEDLGEAATLTGVALRYDSLLPPRVSDFAHGLDAYLRGEADSAVHWLTLALQRSPLWTEAHMALGEVYYHLLPSVDGAPDSLARVEFTLAAADTGFALPRFHLAELAVSRGDSAGAEKAIADFLRGPTEEGLRQELETMRACVRGGRRAVRWGRLADSMPLAVLRAAKKLLAREAYPGCAEDGFRAVFDAADAPLGYRWGAVVALQGLLAAQGRVAEVPGVVDSARARGLDLATQLYLLDDLAGVDLGPPAAAEAARLGAARIDTLRPYVLSMLGTWYARRGDRERAAAMRRALAAQAAREQDRWIARYGDALAARLALLDGDTASAVAGLRSVLGRGRRDWLEWELAEPLPADRLLLAELLLARGEYGPAAAVAGRFDSPAPAVFLPFVPVSLTLRRQAAIALGRAREADGYERRLQALRAGEGARRSDPTHLAEEP